MTETGIHGHRDRLREENAELRRELEAARIANAALAAATGDDGTMPAAFATALGSAQQGRHQAVCLGGSTVAVLGRTRPGDSARAWRMTAAVLATLVPRSAREIQHTKQLPAGVEAVAKRDGGKVVVCVSETATAGAAGCAMRALGCRQGAVVVPLGLAGAALGAGLRAHALRTSAAAAVMASALTAGTVLAPSAPPARSTLTPAVARQPAGHPAGPRWSPAASAAVTGAGVRARTVRQAGARAAAHPAPAPRAAAPAVPSPAPSPPPSSPLPVPSATATATLPRLPVSPSPGTPRPVHTVVKKVAHKVCSITLLGVRVCVRVP